MAVTCHLRNPETFAEQKAGGAAPIETSEGWLLFYHGVTGTCNGFVYSIGGAILDRDEPSHSLFSVPVVLLGTAIFRGYGANVPPIIG